MIRNIFYTLLLCQLIAPPLRAGDYSSLHFTAKDGLSGNNVYSITQDLDGFIWIATETGLSRFDGNTFKKYTIRDGLPSNDITNLFTDYKNRVWIAPFKNEACY